MCNQLNRGTCKFGDCCKFIHDNGKQGITIISKICGFENLCYCLVHVFAVADLSVRKRNIPKHQDAESAGKADSESCTLIFTEGNSALAYAVSYSLTTVFHLSRYKLKLSQKGCLYSVH